MDLEFKKKIEERFKEIPEVLASAIKASNWESIVFDIGRRHSLHVDDIGDIQNELILVLTGIVHPDEFRRIVIEEIGVPEDKADVIIDELNTQINQKIKESLKAIELDREKYPVDDDIDEGKIQTSERDILHNSGIRLGDEPDEVRPEPVSIPVSKPEPAQNVVVEKKEPDVEVAKNLAVPAVFKTRISPAEVKEAGKIYSDPYREPVE